MTKSNKTIHEKTAELDELVAWFNSDNFALEDAVVKFKQAEAIAEAIEKDLLAIKNDIEIVKQKFDRETP